MSVTRPFFILMVIFDPLSLFPSKSGTILLHDIFEDPVGWGAKFPCNWCGIAHLNPSRSRDMFFLRRPETKNISLCHRWQPPLCNIAITHSNQIIIAQNKNTMIYVHTIIQNHLPFFSLPFLAQNTHRAFFGKVFSAVTTMAFHDSLRPCCLSSDGFK